MSVCRNVHRKGTMRRALNTMRRARNMTHRGHTGTTHRAPTIANFVDLNDAVYMIWHYYKYIQMNVGTNF